MDSRLSWLDSALPESNDHSPRNLAPPPVSFGSSSNTSLNDQKSNRNFMFSNASADNLPPRHHNDQAQEESIPLSLTAQELTLDESKTYMRWYSDILARTNSRTISMSDVYQFLSNFRLSHLAQEKINRIFSKILSSINIGEFFALLRVVSHALKGQEPSRSLIKVKTDVPTPPSILSKKRQNDDQEEQDFSAEPAPPVDSPSKPLDLDSFTQFMLTGERPDERAPKKRSKKQKSVKFSDQVVTDVLDVAPDQNLQSSGELDYSLPMDQLMNRLNTKGDQSNNLQVPASAGPIRSPDPEEREILRDMEPQMQNFQNLHSVDTMSVDGVPAQIPMNDEQSYSQSLPHESQSSPQLLRPNMTGPAQMAQMYSSDPAPLRPNMTGPADMARFMSPDPQAANTANNNNKSPKVSLQTFTNQMTGDTAENTNMNAHISPMRSPSPPPVPAMRRARSASQPQFSLNGKPDFLQPPQQEDPNFSPNRLRAASLSPVPPSNAAPPIPIRSPTSNRPTPPPPPPSRRRGGSVQNPSSHTTNNSLDNPPPLPPKVPEFYQNSDENSSTANILDDLKALQEEVDKIRDMAGGF